MSAVVERCNLGSAVNTSVVETATDIYVTTRAKLGGGS